MYIRRHLCTLSITAAVFRLQPIATPNDYMKLKPMVLKTGWLLSFVYCFSFSCPSSTLN